MQEKKQNSVVDRCTENHRVSLERIAGLSLTFERKNFCALAYLMNIFFTIEVVL